MPQEKPYRIKSIAEIHRLMNLPKPQHPLIGMIDLKILKSAPNIQAVLSDFYVVFASRWRSFCLARHLQMAV